jgi:hypothetical protein
VLARLAVEQLRGELRVLEHQRPVVVREADPPGDRVVVGQGATRGGAAQVLEAGCEGAVARRERRQVLAAGDDVVDVLER